MRVSAQTKFATRKRILQSARRLFADNGYDTTTTRDKAFAKIEARVRGTALASQMIAGG